MDSDSGRTEEAYVAWIVRYIRFHGRRHPEILASEHVCAYLSYLAMREEVSASTQNQALAAIAFLYRDVLQDAIPRIDEIVRAKRPRKLPVVLTRAEVRAVLRGIHGVSRLVARVLYGSGVRLLEGLSLRVKGTSTWRAASC